MRKYLAEKNETYLFIQLPKPSEYPNVLKITAGDYWCNLIQKVLEGANIKLGSVVSDVMGVSARDMLNAIAEGEEDPEKLANFARRTMKKKKD
ncbi:hypothetical protein [Peribacillus simplex]|uniref:hypothetical protein n=1 Tax=Peribacillus TaxID=2675229 RepID=UPI0036DA8713